MFAVWLGFLAVLGALIVVGAEAGLRARRGWIAAHYTPPAPGDPRFVVDPMVGYRNRPNYRYEGQAPDGSVVHYSNNSLGWRGPEITPAKPTGVRRVVVVGGSTVYGALDDEPDTLSQRLEILLRARLGGDVQVINGGVPGYTALREVALACSARVDLQPDVIVAVDGLNDIFYGTLEEWPAQVAADELGMLADGRCPEIPTMVDRTMFPSGQLDYHSRMLYRDARLLTYRALHLGVPPAPRVVSERIVALHAGSLGLLARYGRDHHSTVITALQPLVAVGHKTLSREEVTAVEREGYWDVSGWAEIAQTMYAQFATTTAAAVEAECGTFVDLSNAFENDTGATYAEDAVHYRALGQQRLAEALAPLVEQGLNLTHDSCG